MNKYLEYFLLPNIAFFIFIVFVLIYLIFLEKEGAFTEKFLHIGPGTNENNTTSFLNMKLDTWHKVILVYILSFFSAVLTSYYRNVVGQNMHAYIWNPIHSLIVPYSKFWSYLITITEPFIYFFLDIIQFFTTLTMQLQFIALQFVGTYLAQVPFDLLWLNKKRFASK